MVNVLGQSQNFARTIGLVPLFFQPGCSTVPGVYCNNYAVANVASVAIHATLQVASPSSSRQPMYETRQIDERLNPSLVHVGPGIEVAQTCVPLSRRLLDLDYY